jgi:hypothetical protein
MKGPEPSYPNAVEFGNPSIPARYFNSSYTRGKRIAFNTSTNGSNEIILSIQIGDDIYGSKGGIERFSSVLPQDGWFYLKKIQSIGQNSPLTYFSANINGQDVSAGTECITELYSPFACMEISSPNDKGFLIRLMGIGSDNVGVYLVNFEILKDIAFKFGISVVGNIVYDNKGRSMVQPGDNITFHYANFPGYGNETLLNFISAVTIGNTTYGTIPFGNGITTVQAKNASLNFMPEFLQVGNYVNPANLPSMNNPYMGWVYTGIDGTWIDIGTMYYEYNDQFSYTTLACANILLTLVGIEVIPTYGMITAFIFSGAVY